LLNGLAPAAFQLIEESLRVDMTMAVCRLSDPAQSLNKKDNLSMETLVQRMAHVPGLHTLWQQFQDECKPVRPHRHKRWGQTDFKTALNPKDNPLPGIGRTQIDRILQLAAAILNTVYCSVVDGELWFRSRPIGNGRDLVHWLKVAAQHLAEETEHHQAP
jgi:hypothetical protein